MKFRYNGGAKFGNLIQLDQEIQNLDEPFSLPVHAGNFSNGSKLLGTDRFKAIVSKKENKILSVVSQRYSIVQSREVLKSVVSALQKLGINDVTGTLTEQNGRTYAKVMLPKFISEGSAKTLERGRFGAVESHDIQLGFLLINSYDASKSLSLSGFAVRLVCSNGMVAPVTLGTAFVRKHVGNISLKVEEAVKQMIETIVERSPYLTKLIEEANKETYESYDEMREVLKELGFGEKVSEKIFDKLEQKENKYTRWQLYNAITSFYTRKKLSENARISKLKVAEKLLIRAEGLI